jgi:hypothetical protein
VTILFEPDPVFSNSRWTTNDDGVLTSTIAVVTFARRGTFAHSAQCSDLQTLPYQRASVRRIDYVVTGHDHLAEVTAAHGPLDKSCICMGWLTRQTPTREDRITDLRRTTGWILKSDLHDLRIPYARAQQLRDLAARHGDEDSVRVAQVILEALDALRRTVPMLDSIFEMPEFKPVTDLKPV